MKIIPRRPLDDDNPGRYRESDLDFVHNNLDAAVELLTKGSKDDWIPVGERLPAPNVQVLTYSSEIRGSPYRLLTTNNGRFFSDVTHWKPVYPPTKKKAKDE